MEFLIEEEKEEEEAAKYEPCGSEAFGKGEEEEDTKLGGSVSLRLK